MEDRPEYHVYLEQSLLDVLSRIVSRPRATLLDPPVPLELIQPDLERFKEHSALHIEQAARSCVYRIAVRPHSTFRVDLKNAIGESITSHGFDNANKLDGSSESTMAYAYDFLDILLIFSENSSLTYDIQLI
jgi:hypothetical protein